MYLWTPWVSRRVLQASFYPGQDLFAAHKTHRPWMHVQPKDLQAKSYGKGANHSTQLLRYVSRYAVDWQFKKSKSNGLKSLQSLKMPFLLCSTGMWNSTSAVTVIEKMLVELRGKNEAYCWFHSYKTWAIVNCKEKAIKPNQSSRYALAVSMKMCLSLPQRLVWALTQ